MGEADRRWQHPWLRIQLLLRALLATRWDAETWRQVRTSIPKALALKGRLERAGWFN
jgi:hypothetical protein